MIVRVLAPEAGTAAMRNLDLSSWNGLLSTLLGLVLVTLIAVGMRMLVMQTIQRRQQRENRQINERLRTLIAAYKTLGGSFTGDLAVDPSHLRDQRRRAREGAPATMDPAVAAADAGDVGVSLAAVDEPASPDEASDRKRRIRDAVEAALSDIILLGTEEQVRLAAQAASEMVAGRPVHMAALVVSLRGFIRHALDLEPVPHGLAIPDQGPLRASGGPGGKGGGREGGTGGRGGGMGGLGAGAGGLGMGLGVGHRAGQDEAAGGP